MFAPLLHAIPATFQLDNVVAVMIGLVGGIIVGALPGLTASMGITVLLPLTFGMSPLVALGMMAGIYNGAMYGGAIPAVLLRIPGTPAAVATTFDGYAMTQKGEAARAMQISCLGSVLGSIVSAISLILLAPPLATVTLAFGPAEYVWVAVFGLASVGVLLGKDPFKGLLAGFFGLLLGTIGIDQVSGHERFTFDNLNLVEGFSIITLLTGLFALPPAIQMAEQAVKRGIPGEVLRLKAKHGLFYQWRSFVPVWIRSSIIGIIIGILPGAGGNMAALLAYNDAKRITRNPDPPFGEGNPLGVCAAETANNADTAASLIPTLTLGVPGSSVAAIIMGGLMIHGLQPGPSLFREHADVVYGFMLQMLMASVLLIFFGGMLATRIFAQVLRLPPILLVSVILSLCVIGVYSVNNSFFDLWMMLLFGMIGYTMEKTGYPIAPAVLGLILGGMAEQNLRLALIISRGDWTVLFTRPVSLIVIALILVTFAIPVIQEILRRRGSKLQIVGD
ncbi:MAG: tripartite tricarboxylate transporter permease [Alphaproteobacteria bacterium]|nr:tripartite tricarboxylate transporter permease [Alphaproteobacteria bacterium]